MKKQVMQEPKFTVGEDVEYFRRGIGYRATVRRDLGILRGAGRRYCITTRDDGDQLNYFVFDVAERFLIKPDNKKVTQDERT